MNLTDRSPIFIGFKLDGTLRRALQSLSGSSARYVSTSDPSFLMICRLGKDDYVGKIVEERLTTDRVEDIRRNVLSILQRVVPDHRFPETMEILAAGGSAGEGTDQPPDRDETNPGDSSREDRAKP